MIIAIYDIDVIKAVYCYPNRIRKLTISRTIGSPCG
jgi:hypothetical protein